jgi:hypothetical protein
MSAPDRRLLLVGGVLAVGLLAGCAQAAPSTPAAPDPPSPTFTPSTAPYFACKVTSTAEGSGGDYASQFTVTATNPSGSITYNLMSVAVVLYGSRGQELASNPAVSFMQTIPPGQSVSATGGSDSAPGVTSCSVTSWGG